MGIFKMDSYPNSRYLQCTGLEGLAGILRTFVTASCCCRSIASACEWVRANGKACIRAIIRKIIVRPLNNHCWKIKGRLRGRTDDRCDLLRAPAGGNSRSFYY